MITLQLTKEQMDNIDKNLKKCEQIFESDSTPAEKEMALAYGSLAKALHKAILTEGQMIMVGREERLCDTIDRPEMHNINIANRPSDMQLKAYKEEHKDDNFTDPTKEEECNGWMK